MELMLKTLTAEELVVYRSKQREKMKECVKKLSEGERKALEEEFKLFDKDNSGFITKKELLSVLRDLNVYKTTEAEELGANQMFLNVKHDGRINASEFIGMMALEMKLAMGEEELREAFTAFDLDGSGTITSKELKAALCCLGDNFLSKEECTELMSLADCDNDGSLDVNEFVKVFVESDLGRPLPKRSPSAQTRRVSPAPASSEKKTTAAARIEITGPRCVASPKSLTKMKSLTQTELGVV